MQSLAEEDMMVGLKIINVADPRLFYESAIEGHARAPRELRSTYYLRRSTVSPRGFLTTYLLLRSAPITSEGSRDRTLAGS